MLRRRNTACTSSACLGFIPGLMAGREVARVAACRMMPTFRYLSCGQTCIHSLEPQNWRGWQPRHLHRASSSEH